MYVHPVEGAGLVAMVKRAANQGWRNGCRHYASVFSLSYEYLKSAFRRSSRHSQFEALCDEMDRILLMKEELGGSFTALPESIRRRYFDLILETRDLSSKVLGRPVHVPPGILEAAAALRPGSRSSSRKSEDAEGGSGASSTSIPSAGHHSSRSESDLSSSSSSDERQSSLSSPSSASSSSSPQESAQQQQHGGGDANRKGKTGPLVEAAGTAASRVYVPFREDAFEKEANERLRNLKNRHEGEIAAIVSEANEKLKQFQDEHKMFYDKKVAEMRAQQSAELEQLHRDLHQEKGRSEEGKEHYQVISDLLTETKAGLKLLDEDLQVISSNFYTIEQLLDRTNEEKRALDRISDGYSSSSSSSSSSTGGGSVNLLSSFSSSSSATTGGGGRHQANRISGRLFKPYSMR